MDRETLLSINAILLPTDESSDINCLYKLRYPDKHPDIHLVTSR